MKYLVFVLLTSFFSTAETDIYELSWTDLMDIYYDWIFNDDIGYEMPVAKFGDSVKALAGRTVEIEGYAYPVKTDDGKEIIVLSRYPSNQCFFCGGAGPESVMDLIPVKPFKRGQINMDDRIKVRGVLHLNADNLENLNYVLKQVVLVD